MLFSISLYERRYKEVGIGSLKGQSLKKGPWNMASCRNPNGHASTDVDDVARSVVSL
jgi:hypothetical protein